MDLRQVSYVLAVVDHGTFTRAAASIPVTQPALSQGIRALEAELGVELFHRVGRQVRLSDAGHAFVPEARRLLTDVERVHDAVAQVARVRTGTLDLVSLPTLAVSPLVELIGAFRHRYSGVALRIHEQEGSTGDATRLVTDGTCELGLVELPRHRSVSGLVTRRLQEQEFVAVCPPGTETHVTGRITITELAALPLATTPTGTSSRRILDDAFTRTGFATPRPVVESWHRELLEPLVLSGAAATVLPAPLAERAGRHGAVVAHLDPPLRRSIGLVHRDAPLSPAAEAFLQVAEASPTPRELRV
ncbi:MAG: LysR family transcriptional regulator [Actinobacteria bacterium]|nr:LysR family transcriptional regulator [Actinomycetota bacterium]